MADGVADAQPLRPLAVKQNGEQIVGNHFLDDRRDVRQKLVEIERLGGDARHFQQEVEQLGALAETDFASLARDRRQLPELSR